MAETTTPWQDMCQTLQHTAEVNAFDLPLYSSSNQEVVKLLQNQSSASGCKHTFDSDLFLVVELDVPLQEECAAELLYLEGDVERDGDDVVEEHEERHDVVEHFLGTAA